MKLPELKERLNTAVILITHDFGVVAGMADKIAVMYAGQIIEKGEKRDIFYESTQNTANWRAFIEKRENNRIEAVYNYVSYHDSCLVAAVISASFFVDGDRNKFQIVLSVRDESALAAVSI